MSGTRMRSPAHYPVPAIFTRDKMNCYLDNIRGYLVQATPEEAVRQQTVLWLEHEILVPQHLLRTEFNHRRHGGQGRSDILVLHPSGTESRGILVVECKRPGFPLEERAREQVTHYAAQVGASFCALTNGDEVMTLHRANPAAQWLEIVTPRWNDLLAGKIRRVTPPEQGERWAWSEYGTRPEMLRRLEDSSDLLGHIVGVDSEWHVGAFACNLFDLFVYELNAFAHPIEDDRIVLVKDLGIHSRYFGNAAGGSWASDEYRSFLVFDKRRSSHQVVSLLVTSSLKTTNDAVFKNRAGRTYLVVAVDEGPKSHLSLEACLDATLTKDNVLQGEVELFHSGALTVGRRGSVPRKRVFEFVNDTAPHLLQDRRIFLGKLPSARLIHWSDATDFLLRTIRYALARDELRWTLA